MGLAIRLALGIAYMRSSPVLAKKPRATPAQTRDETEESALSGDYG